MGPPVLLVLLGAAALAGVSALPVERDHAEEMITQCIVEVLSNALSKPNAPPINPECKEILKKSGKNDRERSEAKQLEVRHSKDPAETEKHHTGSMEKDQREAEEESKKYMKESDEEKLAQEEGKSTEEETGQHTPVQEERLHTEEKTHYQETGREERNYHSEEESKESQCCAEDTEPAVPNKKSHSGGTSTDEFRDGNGQRPVGSWHLEEGMQSPYRQTQEGEEGGAEEERSEKYHHESKERGFSRQQGREGSDEGEETEEEKQPYKPKRSHGKHRVGDSYEEKRGRGGEKEEAAEESDTEEAGLWDQWNQHQKHREESEQQREDKSGYHGGRGSEEAKDKRLSVQRSEKYRDRWQESEESSEESSEENKRYLHGEGSNEKWGEERRHHDGSREVRRHHSEGRTYLADEKEEELGRYLSGGSREEQHRAGGRYGVWNNGEEGPQKASGRERRGQARRHHSTEQQPYPGYSEEEEEEEEVEKKHRSSDQVENEEEERYAEREEYRSRLPEENKRTTASYSPFYPLLWWKSRHFEKRDSTGEGKGESRPALKDKSLFPEYNDYDWWEDKQILSALKHKRTEKRNPGKINRNDVERQYKKMDQLAQLLNYRKKSAEFPELYSSGEDLKKRHLTGNDRSLSQRPLTEEEEKELENLAAMDLELQSIAEKLNSLRRG